MIGLLAGVWGKVAAVGMALLGMAALLGGARRAGTQAQLLADIKRKVADRETADEVQGEVAGMGDDAVAAELRERYSRK